MYCLYRSWHSVVTTTEGVFVIGGEGYVNQVNSLLFSIVIGFILRIFQDFHWKKENKQNSKFFLFKNENVNGYRC